MQPPSGSHGNDGCIQTRLCGESGSGLSPGLVPVHVGRSKDRDRIKFPRRSKTPAVEFSGVLPPKLLKISQLSNLSVSKLSSFRSFVFYTRLFHEYSRTLFNVKRSKQREMMVSRCS